MVLSSGQLSVTPGNIHDSIILKPLLELIIHRFTVPFAVVADSAYKTAPIVHLLLRQRITTAISVKMISSLSIEQLHGKEDGSTYQIQRSVKLVHF
ncbi:transposase [Exiguobacterium sp. s133]|uniref:transposase n=1 Tax=Exiguobacterium sp. s133 TaxID=2751213 RepID=UPI001BE52914|nr:transposase [Exiguobacterium sp. s133]